MTQIESLALSRLLDAPFTGYHMSVFSIIQIFDMSELRIQQLIPVYEQEIQTLDLAMGKSYRKENTQLITKTDALRDRLTNRFFNEAKFLKNSPVESEKEDGTILWNAISQYEGITRYEMNKETVLLKAMFRDLDKTEVLEVVVRYNLQDMVNQIKQYNSEVEALLADRVAKQSEITKVETLEQRKVVTNVYNDIVKTVNAVAILEPTAAVIDFIQRVNALIEEYRLVIAHMKSGGSGNEKRKKKENPEDLPEEDNTVDTDDMNE